MKKIRGAIDPYTLGFILSLIGASATYVAHQDEEEVTIQAERSQQTDTADTDSSDDSDT